MFVLSCSYVKRRLIQASMIVMLLINTPIGINWSISLVCLVNHRETCLYKLCKCDDALAKCLTKHPYNKKYVDHRKKHQCNSNLSIDNVTLVEVPDASEKSFDKSWEYD